MVVGEIGYLAAAGAGVLSFLSPCVLPLVPAYLCFLGGVSLQQLTGAPAAPAATANGAATVPVAGRVATAALAFVLGFSAVFIALGAGASAVSGLLLEHKLWLARIAGGVIVVFGLHFTGLIRIPFLNYEARMQVGQPPAGLLGAFVMGLAFAFGWTPCIGPVLATILAVAGREEAVTRGVSLLAAYSAGLGVPFLLAALASGAFMRWMQRFRRHVRSIEIGIGGLLIVTGLMFMSNSFELLGFWLLEFIPILAEIG